MVVHDSQFFIRSVSNDNSTFVVVHSVAAFSNLDSRICLLPALLLSAPFLPSRAKIVLTFHPSILHNLHQFPPSSRIFCRARLLHFDCSTANRPIPLYSFTIDHFLLDSLLLSSILSNPTPSLNTLPCKCRMCNICPFISFLFIQKLKRSFQLKEHFTCSSSNLMDCIWSS